jgi:putative transposase
MGIKRAQRRVDRRHTGSHRRRKAGKLLATAHQTVRRTRQDFPPQEARKLVAADDVLDHVPVANRLTNHHRATAIADVGWRAFLSILPCTAAEAGKQVVAVTPAFTSQACSGCGTLVENGLSVRWQACPDCGTRLHPDQNAAWHILKRGQEQRRLGQSLQAPTPPVGAYGA